MFPFPTPCKGKSKSQPFAHTFALTGRRRFCIDTQGVALGYELAALSGRSRRGLRGIAPERGAYSRIGACPYLPPQLINSRCCPCKGRISWAGLAPQHLSRYEPLTGARFINRPQEVGASPYPKYEPPSGALSPRVWRQVRINRFFATGLRATPQYGFGLRRRNNELNELTNCWAARVRRGELIEFSRFGTYGRPCAG